MQGRRGKRAVARVAATALMALGALTAGTAAASAAASSVVGQWRFDEASGQTAFDDGPFALDGRLGSTDGADPSDPGRIAGLAGGALRFTGADAYVRLPEATALQPAMLTVEAVVRADSSPGDYRYVISRGAQSCYAGSYGLYTGVGGGMAFYVFNGTSFKVSAAVGADRVWDGAWHHVAGVFDGKALRFYLDGHPVGEPVAAPPEIAYALSSPDAYIGTYEGTCTLPFRGDVDLVRLWNGPLAADFVGRLSDAALAPSGTTPPASPSPGSVPTATPADSQGAAPGTRSPLPAAQPGQTLAAPSDQPQRAPAATPGAPARACVVRSSTKRLRVGRRSRLTVRVALRGKPLKAVRVVATEAKSRKRLASARTATDGRARLRVTPRRRGTITLKVLGRADCAATALTAVPATRK
jgi:hypothetical protein